MIATKLKFQVTPLLYLFPLLFWVIVYFGFRFDGLYGQDSYEYLRYAESIHRWWRKGNPPGDYFWGVYYPIFGTVLRFFLGNAAMSMQLISVISLIVISVYSDKLITLLYSIQSPHKISFVFLTLSPWILIHSVLIMSDVLAAALIVLSIYYFLRTRNAFRLSHLFLGSWFAATAIFTRYAAAVILLPICLTVAIALVRQRKLRMIVLPLLALVMASIPHFAIRPANSTGFLSHQWLLQWNWIHFFQSDFSTVDGQIGNHVINLVYGFFSFFHPAFFAFGGFLIGLTVFWRSCGMTKYQKIIGVSVLLYALFLAGIPFQNKRFLILSFPLVILFTYPFLNRILKVVKHKNVLLIVAATGQLLLVLYYGKPFYERNRLEQYIAIQMKPYAGQSLYVFDIDIALKHRNSNFQFKSLWNEPLTNAEPNALVLVNDQQLKKQWQGRNPLRNWEFIHRNYAIRKLKSFDGNFNLYQIGARK